MTIKEKKAVKKYLPKKWVNTVATEYNVTTDYVYKVFNGIRANTQIEGRIIHLAYMEKSKVKQLQSKFKK